MRHLIFNQLVSWTAALGLLGGVSAQAQSTPEEQDVVVVEVYAPEDGESYSPLSKDELEELVGPVALYPDDLIAVVLPASSYPLQIVQAARYLEAHAEDNSLAPDEDWDDAVVALLNYPEVVALMNDDLDWTWKLGEAVVYQQSELMEAIQSFRDRAYLAGNLESDEHQIVTYDPEVIKISPVEREVIYVPYYEPERVVVYQSAPVYHYYPRRYPLYYYPYPTGYSFSSGFFWGLTSAFSLGWHTNRLHLHHYHYNSHPYYGRSYYRHNYLRRYSPRRYTRSHGNPRPRALDPTRRRDHNRNDRHNYVQHRDGDMRQADRRRGARPGTRRDRVRAVENRTRSANRSRPAETPVSVQNRRRQANQSRDRLGPDTRRGGTRTGTVRRTTQPDSSSNTRANTRARVQARRRGNDASNNPSSFVRSPRGNQAKRQTAVRQQPRSPSDLKRQATRQSRPAPAAPTTTRRAERTRAQTPRAASPQPNASAQSRQRLRARAANRQQNRAPAVNRPATRSAPRRNTASERRTTGTAARAGVQSRRSAQPRSAPRRVTPTRTQTRSAPARAQARSAPARAQTRSAPARPAARSAPPSRPAKAPASRQRGSETRPSRRDSKQRR